MPVPLGAGIKPLIKGQKLPGVHGQIKPLITVIKETVEINEDIAKSIAKENSEFSNIAGMVQNNAEDIVALSNQVDSINDMITELEKILEA